MDGDPSAYKYGRQAAPEGAQRRPIVKTIGIAGKKCKKGVGWSVKRSWESGGVAEGEAYQGEKNHAVGALVSLEMS